MRGGTVNHKRVRYFIKLINMLWYLKAIDDKTYHGLRELVSYINPLRSDHKFFIDKFTN